MKADTVDKAERMARARATVMALAALVLPINLAMQFGDPNYSSAGARGGSWILVIGLWVFMLWNGGGLRLRAPMRNLLNDELSLQNRSRALATGFYAAMVVGLVVYVLQWWWPISAGDALKSVTALSLTAALLRFAWLEWR